MHRWRRRPARRRRRSAAALRSSGCGSAVPGTTPAGGRGRRGEDLQHPIPFRLAAQPLRRRHGPHPPRQAGPGRPPVHRARRGAGPTPCHGDGRRTDPTLRPRQSPRRPDLPGLGQPRHQGSVRRGSAPAAGRSPAQGPRGSDAERAPAADAAAGRGSRDRLEGVRRDRRWPGPEAATRLPGRPPVSLRASRRPGDGGAARRRQDHPRQDYQGHGRPDEGRRRG
jgi:hypothetical protein